MAAVPVATARRRALLLPVGADLYAVGLEAVREVLEPASLTRLPGAGRVVLGLLNVRGQVVPVLDTGVLLDLAPLGRPVAVAVVRCSRGLAALGADDVPAAVTLGDDLGPSALELGVGRHRVPGGVATEIDLEALLNQERLR